MNKQKTTPYDLTLNQSFQTKVERNQQKTNIFFFLYYLSSFIFLFEVFVFLFCFTIKKFEIRMTFES